MGRLEGIISSFNSKTGYGFIHCAKIAGKYGDVFCHARDIGGEFKEGDIVSFTFDMVDGKARATSVDFLANGHKAATKTYEIATRPQKSPKMSSGGGRFSGIITSFNPKSGYGFIHCAKIADKYGDVFLHKNDVGEFREGDEVAFSFNVVDGKARATAVTRQQEQQAPPSGGGRFSGTIVSFNTKSGYGFIHCPRIADKYGDVFLHKNEVGEFKEGDDVTFSFGLTVDGKARAIAVARQQAQRAPPSGGGRFSGTIVSFNTKSGYGFIHCPRIVDKYGEVFLHKNEVGEFKEGDDVTFSFGLTEDGKARATAVARARGPPASAPWNAGSSQNQQTRKRPRPSTAADRPKMFSGTIESFNSKKGWGFITCPQIQGDVFLHSNDIGGGSFQKGDSVSFSFDTDNGKPRATSVQVLKRQKKN